MRKNEFVLLSDREEQVLLLSTKGFTDKEIARKLNLSIATVNTYWVRIRTKLGGANRAELVAAALHKNAEETLTAKERENQRLISEVVRRAEAERALRESQGRLQAVIDRTPEVVFIKDTQGYYTLVNAEFEELVVKDRREILTKRDYDIFGPTQGEVFRMQDQAVLETGKSLECDIAIETASGPRNFLLVKFPLFNIENVPNAVCGFAREITGRIEFENRLRESERRYKALIENSTDIITLLSSAGTILYVSPAIGPVLGIPPEELIGKNAFHFVDRDDIISLKADFARLLQEPGTKIRGEYRLKHPSGRSIYVDGQGQNLLDDPAVKAVVLNYREVTDRKLSERRIEAQLAVARALAEAANVDTAMAKIVRSLCEILSFDFGGVWLVSESGNHFERCIGWHSSRKELAEFSAVSLATRLRTDEDFPGRVLADKGPCWDSDLRRREYSRSEAMRAANLKTAIGFPIVDGGNMLGVIELFARQTAQVDDSFLSVLDIVGHQIGQFLQRKSAEMEELRTAKQLSAVHSQREFAEQELKAANEGLERRVRTRTIELEEANVRLQEEVAERKRAESDLLESFAFGRQILDSSVDGIIGFDSKLRTTVWNRSIEEMSGRSKEDALGQCLLDILPFFSEELEVIFQRILTGEAVMTPKQPFSIEATGQKGYFEARYSPIRNEDNQVMGGLGVIRRVTGTAGA